MFSFKKIAVRAARRIMSRFQMGVYDAVFRRRPYDYISTAYRQAALEGAEFYLENMRLAHNAITKDKLLIFSLGKVSISGMWLEFGVFKGRDITVMAGETEQVIYGFDSFEGLPEDWTHFQKKGRFSLDGQLPIVPENVKLIKGWFEDTLPGFLEKHKESVSFLHVDSDLYSSAKFVLRELNDRIVPGTIILFDDFLNYPGWLYSDGF